MSVFLLKRVDKTKPGIVRKFLNSGNSKKTPACNEIRTVRKKTKRYFCLPDNGVCVSPLQEIKGCAQAPFRRSRGHLKLPDQV